MSELNHEQIAQRLQHLTELSVELNGIKDVNALLERILQTAKRSLAPMAERFIA